MTVTFPYTMDCEKLYLLDICGTVNPGKEREFQQTVRFVFNHLPHLCICRNLIQDCHHTGLYHITTIWRSPNALMSFRGSREFHLVTGAFETLGSFPENKDAVSSLIELSEIQADWHDPLKSRLKPPGTTRTITHRLHSRGVHGRNITNQ